MQGNGTIKVICHDFADNLNGKYSTNGPIYGDADVDVVLAVPLPYRRIHE
jgi:hypothetical protein